LGFRLYAAARLPAALLRLPVVGDNGDMIEPPKADPPKRKRRWFQFSLRSLMIVVTLLAVACAYVGWQAKIVQERKVMFAQIESAGGYWTWQIPTDPRPTVSWVRQLLGDEPRQFLYLPPTTSAEECRRIGVLFSEATIIELSAKRR
jgi:hypothetical protein